MEVLLFRGIVKMIDKQRAIVLKEAGLTNKEVAQELGCSEDWCKRNLKGIKKKDIEPEDFEYLKEKGKGKSCVTTGEIYNKLLPVTEAQDIKKAKKHYGSILNLSKALRMSYNACF